MLVISERTQQMNPRGFPDLPPLSQRVTHSSASPGLLTLFRILSTAQLPSPESEPSWGLRCCACQMWCLIFMRWGDLWNMYLLKAEAGLSSEYHDLQLTVSLLGQAQSVCQQVMMGQSVQRGRSCVLSHCRGACCSSPFALLLLSALPSFPYLFHESISDIRNKSSFQKINSLYIVMIILSVVSTWKVMTKNF